MERASVWRHAARGLRLGFGSMWRRRAWGIVVIALASTPTRRALADVDPASGIDFVRIGAVGNAPWPGNGTLDDRAVGRGGVNYEYRIGRLEVTTGQWVEFFNAAFDRPANDRIPHVTAPTFWGGIEVAPTVPGGRRWIAPGNNAMLPTGNISWRTAAISTNWLCNGKALNRSAFLSGAYEVSTFGYNGIQFTDQLTHTPGAPYYIPSWDEWLKAVHFDPNRFGDGQPGWWTGPLSRDGIPSFGPPDLRDANWGEFPGWQSIPLGAYPRSSPWGLKDPSGATTEWTESYLESSFSGERWRIFDGSYWADDSVSSGGLDLINYSGGDDPSISTFDHGLRLAASVPTPGTCIPVAAATLWWARSRKQRNKHGYPKRVGHPSVTLSRCVR